MMVELGTTGKRILEREVMLGTVIGSGTFGHVYMAEPMPLAKKPHFVYPQSFVVKVVRKKYCTDKYVDMIHRELDTLKNLHHPYIVSYIGSWVEQSACPQRGCYCLAMHYCSGGDLHGAITACQRGNKFMHQDLLVMIMVHVLTALNFAHSKRVMHRDVKPDNVFLVNDNNGGAQKAMIGDFGLARPLEETKQLITTRVGTPCYCSPQIVGAKPYSNKTDIFSFGAMIFELMTFEKAFWKRGYNDQRIFRDVTQMDPMPRLRHIVGTYYDPSLVSVVEACLTKHEEGRPSAFTILTTLCSRLTKFVRLHQISLVNDCQTTSLQRQDSPQNADASPVAAFADAERVKKSERQQRSPGTPAAVAAPSPSPQRVSPCRKSPARTSAEKKPLREQPVSLTSSEIESPQQREPLWATVSQDMLSSRSDAQRLLELLHREFPSHIDEKLRQILPKNYELQAFLKAFCVAYAGKMADPEVAQTITFKILHALKVFYSVDSVLIAEVLTRTLCLT